MKNFANYFRATSIAGLTILFMTLITVSLSVAPAAAAPAKHAPTGPSDPSTSCTSNTGNCDLVAKDVQPVVNLLAALFGTIAAISMILGGIQYTTSEGDPQKTAGAKKRITNTIIAIVAFIFLYSFLQFLIPGGIFNRSTG